MADFSVTCDGIVGAAFNSGEWNGIAVALRLVGAAAKAGTLTYDFGWSTVVNAAGNNPDTDSPALALTVTRSGYTVSAGSVTTTTRERMVYGTIPCYKAYPNATEFEEVVDGADLLVYVALSRYVYKSTVDTNIDLALAAGCITDGTDSNLSASISAITNSSTKDATTAKGAWMDMPGGRMGATCTDRFMARHESGIAAVLFTITDESAGSVTQVVETATWHESETYPTLPGLLAHQCSASMATLADGDGITVRAQVYPNDGDSSSVFDTNAQTLAHLRNRVHRLDRGGATPNTYVYVDPANGGAGVASATAATARATPYSDFWTAVKAARDFINTNYSVANSLDGAIIRLMDNNGADQNHYWGRTGFTTEMTAPWEFARIQKDPLATGVVKFVDKPPSTPTQNILCQKVRIEDVIVEPSGNSGADQSGYFASVGAADWYVLIRSPMVLTSTNSGHVLFASTVEMVSTYECGMDGWYPPLRGNQDIWPDITGKESSVLWGSNSGGAICGFRVSSVSDSYQSTSEAVFFNTSGDVTGQFIDGFELTNLSAVIFQPGHAMTRCYLGNGIMRRYNQGGSGVCAVEKDDMIDCLWENVSMVGQRFNPQNAPPNTAHSFDRWIVRSLAAPYIASGHGDVSATHIGARAKEYGCDWIGIYNGRADTTPFRFDGTHVFTYQGTASNIDFDQVNDNTDATPTIGSEVVGLLNDPYVTHGYYNDGSTQYAGGPIGALPTAAPTITNVSPATATLNSTGVTVTLTGTGFVTVGTTTATITASGKAAHTVNSVTVNSATDIDLDVDFDTGEAGTYTITLTNPDGQTATGTVEVTGGKPPIGSSGTALGGGSFKISMGISL